MKGIKETPDAEPDPAATGTEPETQDSTPAYWPRVFGFCLLVSLGTVGMALSARRSNQAWDELEAALYINMGVMVLVGVLSLALILSVCSSFKGKTPPAP